MKLLLSPILAAFLIYTAIDIARADDVKQGLGTSIVYSADNENFYTRRIAAEYFPAFTNADFLSGVRYTDHHYEQNAWSRNGHQISLLHRQIDQATANGLQIEAGLFSQGQHDLITTDANFRTMLSAQTGAEIFINRDWVETALALDKGVNFTLGGLAVDQVLSQKVTVVALAGIQNFSDDNSRNHGRLKLIYQPDIDLGLTLQLRYRAYTSSSNNVGSAYFNPSQYDETMLALGWRQRISGWMTSLTAGSGRQRVASDPLSPTMLLELSLQSPIRNKFYSFRINAIMSQSAAFNGPDYRYSYLHGEWILAI